MRWLDSLTDSTDMNLSKLRPGDSEGQGSLSCCCPWACRVRHNLATEQQNIILSVNSLVQELFSFKCNTLQIDKTF